MRREDFLGAREQRGVLAGDAVAAVLAGEEESVPG
jgi:hypothetical protein